MTQLKSRLGRQFGIEITTLLFGKAADHRKKVKFANFKVREKIIKNLPIVQVFFLNFCNPLSKMCELKKMHKTSNAAACTPLL